MTVLNLKRDETLSSIFCPPGIAVIGSGYWGRNLVRNYRDLGALRVICDKNETLLSQFKDQYPDVDTCLAINEVLLRT